MPGSVYDAIGEDGFDRLTKAFYSRVPDDDILGPMYPAGQTEEARVRLRDFLIARFGGSQRYVYNRGQPRLRMRHKPFVIDWEARDRWMKLMTKALDEVDFDPHVRMILTLFFESTSTFMINQDLP